MKYRACYTGASSVMMGLYNVTKISSLPKGVVFTDGPEVRIYLSDGRIGWLSNLVIQPKKMMVYFESPYPKEVLENSQIPYL